MSNANTDLQKSQGGDLFALARAAVDNGLTPKGTNHQQAYLAIVTGAELGLSPAQAMRAVSVIQGKISMNAQAMAGLLQKNGGALFWHENTDKAADVEVLLPATGAGMPPSRARVRFTIEQAKQAGLNSGVWRSYPMAMLANRAMSQACRMAAPATFMGIYDPDEIGEEPAPRFSAPAAGIASVGYDTIPEAPQIEAAPPLPPKVEAMRARLEANGWLPDAIAKFGEPATWDLADVIAWGKARKAEIEAAAAKVAAFGESGGEE
jgi:hypothetical protein